MMNSLVKIGCLLLVGHVCCVISQNIGGTNPSLAETVKHVHRVNLNSQKYLSKNNKPESGSENPLLSLVSEDLAARAEEILAADWKYDVSSLCLNHTEMILEGLIARDRWALQMIDAMGKPPSRLLELNLAWLGSFDECVGTEVTLYEDPVNKIGPYQPFSTQYCLAMVKLGGTSASLLQAAPTITIGMCLPKSCSNRDVGGLTNTLISLIPNSIINTTTLPPSIGYCKTNGDLELDGKAKFVIVICSLFLAVMTVATCYDIYIVFWLNRSPDQLPSYKKALSNGYGSIPNGHMPDTEKATLLDGSSEGKTFHKNGVSHQAGDLSKVNAQSKKYHPGTAGKALLAFSVYTNAPKILNTSQPAGTLTAVNGVRFISMLWVLLGHTYAFGLQLVENITTYLPSMYKRLTFQAISNATVAVDTFFVLSGLLVAYLCLKEMKKRGGAGKFKWGMFYFHRFWRLTPPYMLVLMLYVPLVKYWLKGPLAPEGGVEQDECRDTWWTNMLYINNVYKTDKMCMAWSWYLANDMQFYIISPLMLVPLYYSHLWGAVSCLVFVATGTISTGAISKHYEVGSNAILGANGGEGFDDIYIKPWCRIAPYAVGIYAGYLLYKYDGKFKMPKIVNAIGWTAATVVALLCLYGLYDSDGQEKLGVDMSAFYNATFRLAWGICIAWVIFACANGYGGPVNTLLSWKGIIPLSRLTYCTYLVHPVIMYTYYFSRQTTMYWYDLELTYLFLAHSCLAFAVAFVVSLAFESPMMGLEKALLGRGK